MRLRLIVRTAHGATHTVREIDPSDLNAEPDVVLWGGRVYRLCAAIADGGDTPPTFEYVEVVAYTVPAGG